MALVLAAIVAVALGATTAFADLDESMTIEGLDAGDTVNYYQVLEWDDGWKLTTDFASLETKTIDTDEDGTPDESVLDHILAGTLSFDDVNAIATLAGDTADGTGAANASGVWSEADPDAGLYLALIVPAKAGTLYNPVILGVDYDDEDGTNAITLPLNYENTSIAKKTTVTVVKTATDLTYTYNVGDLIDFKVETTIPVYSSVYTDPFFNVTDSLSDGLELVSESVAVEDDSGNAIADANFAYEPGADLDGYTIEFTPAYIKGLTAAQPIVITYKAKLTSEAPFNVNEEDNTVTVEFSNDPTDKDGKGIVKDKTKHYTFSIDAGLLGVSGYENSEIVKVAKDKDGNPIYDVITLDNGTEISPLEGAVFGLYKTNAGATAEDDADLYTNDVFEGTVTTDANGKLNIPGLDEGTYYLKELSAPAGFVRDLTVHTVEIDATLETVNVTEYFDPSDEKWYEENNQEETRIAVQYDVQILDSYTVKVDGTTSTYTMVNDGPIDIQQSTEGDVTTEIVNTPGQELPSTGGMGTRILYTIGGIMLVGGAVALVSKKRVANMEK